MFLRRQSYLLTVTLALLIAHDNAQASPLMNFGKTTVIGSGLIHISDAPEVTGKLPPPDAAAAASLKEAPPEQQQAAIGSMVDGLRAKLEKNPSSLDGWLLLEKSYRVMGDNTKADGVLAKIKEYQKSGVIKDQTPPSASVPAPTAPMASAPLTTASPASLSLTPAASPSSSTKSTSGLVNIPLPPAMGGAKTAESSAPSAPSDHKDANMDGMIEGLRLKLDKNPNNYSGWVLLSNSYRAVGQKDKAEAVDKKIKELQAKGIITPPSPEKASGQTTPATTPPAAASSAGSAIPMNDQETAKAIMSAPADQQQVMIRGMVDKLADKLKANPNDLDGWQKLARAYQVLGDTDKAKAAEAKIQELQGKNKP